MEAGPGLLGIQCKRRDRLKFLTNIYIRLRFETSVLFVVVHNCFLYSWLGHAAILEIHTCLCKNSSESVVIKVFSFSFLLLFTS